MDQCAFIMFLFILPENASSLFIAADAQKCWCTRITLNKEWLTVASLQTLNEAKKSRKLCSNFQSTPLPWFHSNPRVVCLTELVIGNTNIDVGWDLH